jgi:DNA-binding response OmpR family regulator
MKILLIEDERHIYNFIKDSLKSAFFEVDIANDGEVGATLANDNYYDLIILDLGLPKKPGLEVLKEIRASGKSVPILVLSVKSEVTSKIELLDAGADDYLVKPFSLEELLARIRALLRRPEKVEGENLVVDDLLLDTKGCIVKLKEKEIYLTRKEFMLLEYLMRNKGLVLSRAMIMEHVWDMNADPFSNTIESHILSLRRKIENQDKQKFIITVPGRGYKFSTGK